MTNLNPGSPSGALPDQGRSDSIARIAFDYQALMHRLVSSHLSEFMEVSVTMSQAKVLYTVLAAGSLRMSELAARLHVSLSTTSGQVDRLVEQGLLERHDDPADRRQVVVSVTTSGEAILERFRELNNEQLLALLERIDDDALVIVEQAMRILAGAAARPTDPGDLPAHLVASADRKDDIS